MPPFLQEVLDLTFRLPEFVSKDAAYLVRRPTQELAFLAVSVGALCGVKAAGWTRLVLLRSYEARSSELAQGTEL